MQLLARLEERAENSSCERTRKVHLLPEATSGPCSNGPLVVLHAGGPTPIHLYVTGAGPTRQPVKAPTQSWRKTCAYCAGACVGALRSRIRTASMRFSRTDSTRIE